MPKSVSNLTAVFGSTMTHTIGTSEELEKLHLPRMAKNTVFVLVFFLLNRFSDFFVAIYAARHLGVSQFGILTFAFAYGNVQHLRDHGIEP